MDKYKYHIITVCCLALLIYCTYTHYFLEAGEQIKAMGKTQDESSGETGLIKNVEVVVENDTKLESSSAVSHKRVDPSTLSRGDTEQILRDSIESFHSNNFIKPPHEVCKKRLPSAIVIGVAKCGTRELVDFMHLHPHIQIWHGKTYEMNYFAQRQIKGIGWLTDQMPCSFSNQMTIMKHAGYFHRNDMDVPERIRTFNSSIKLILIVREPIARSYSRYTFRKTQGHGYEKPFDELVINAIMNEKRELPILLKRSIYDEDMERWLKVFNLSQILILEQNDFKQNPVSVLVKVEKFLGLGHYIKPDMFVYNAETGFRCIRSRLTTTGMACYASNRGRTQEPISKEVRSKLTKFFKPKNERFFRMIGKSFDW